MTYPKATSGELLRKIKENRSRRLGEHLIYSDYLKMNFSVKMIPISEFLEIVNVNAEDFSLQLEAYKHLIYNHCQILHNKDFQTEDYVQPYDVVLDVFDNNLQAIAEFADKITDLYGLEGLKDEIKN